MMINLNFHENCVPFFWLELTASPNYIKIKALETAKKKKKKKQKKKKKKKKKKNQKNQKNYKLKPFFLQTSGP